MKYGEMREKENKINENSIIKMTSCLENIKNLLGLHLNSVVSGF